MKNRNHGGGGSYRGIRGPKSRMLEPQQKHLFLASDHTQLKTSMAMPKLVKTHRLDVSMFERMVSKGIEYKKLEVRRRMRPKISALVSNLFYPMLKDHPFDQEFKDVRGFKEQCGVHGSR